jgi:hypothetical protein
MRSVAHPTSGMPLRVAVFVACALLGLHARVQSHMCLPSEMPPLAASPIYRPCLAPPLLLSPQSKDHEGVFVTL